MRRFLLAVLVLVVVALLTAPVLAQNDGGAVTRADVEEARRQVDETKAELEQLAARFEAAYQEQVALEDLLTRLTGARQRTEADLVDARRALQQRAVELYMQGGPRVGTVLDVAAWDQHAVQGEYLGEVAARDGVLLVRLHAAAAAYADEVRRTDEALRAQRRLTQEFEAIAADVGEELAVRQGAYREAAETFRIQEERRLAALWLATSTTTTTTTVAATTTTTAAAPAPEPPPAATTTTTTAAAVEAPPPPGGLICPVAGPTTFVDSWGAPRSGGRRHTGVDMLAERGTPLVAMEPGTIVRIRQHSLGGLTVRMEGMSGDEYYYAHLDSYAEGIHAGMTLDAGQVLGTVGSTGNASPSVPHLHLAIYPGGGSPVNPYPIVAGVC